MIIMPDLNLESKQDVIQQIYQNTKQQTQYIEEEDGEGLLRLLDERQALLDTLGEMNKQRQELHQETGQREPVGEEETQQLLQKTYNLELENQKKLEAVKNNLYLEIREFQEGKKSHVRRVQKTTRVYLWVLF